MEGCRKKMLKKSTIVLMKKYRFWQAMSNAEFIWKQRKRLLI
jgi:hypothetical protein